MQGLGENRGAEVSIVNSVNMNRVLHNADSVKVVVLLEHNSITAQRGAGMNDLMANLIKLFGSTQVGMTTLNSALTTICSGN